MTRGSAFALRVSRIRLHGSWSQVVGTGALHTDLHHDPAVSSATAAAFSSAAKAKTKALTPEAVAAAAHKDVSSSKKT